MINAQTLALAQDAHRVVKAGETAIAAATGLRGWVMARLAGRVEPNTIRRAIICGVPFGHLCAIADLLPRTDQTNAIIRTARIRKVRAARRAAEGYSS